MNEARKILRQKIRAYVGMRAYERLSGMTLYETDLEGQKMNFKKNLVI